jgi:hypothetical protein
VEPSRFKEQNGSLGAPQNFDPEQSEAASEIVSLPVFSDGEQCISLWRMSWRERLSALLFGRVWLQVLSGPTQPPVALTTARTIFEEQDGG